MQPMLTAYALQLCEWTVEIDFKKHREVLCILRWGCHVFSTSVWVYNVLLGLHGLSWIRSFGWLWIIKIRTLMIGCLINTFSSGNKIFVNVSPCQNNKLDVVPQTCLLSFKMPDRGKELNNTCCQTDWFDWGFFFKLILLLCHSLCWGKSTQIPSF